MRTTTVSKFGKMRIAFLFSILFLSVSAHGSPTTFSYQGRITSAAGGSPGFTMASFSFSIMVDKAHGNSPNCTIYREQADLIPISAEGLFDVAIGNGTPNFPTSSSKVYDYMNNSGTVTCAEGGTFLLAAADKRFLDVQFNPNGTSAWNHIVPASEIRSVPYATNAISAEKLGGLVATDYIRKTDLATCATGQFMTYNGSAFACDTPVGGGGVDSSYTIKGLVQFLTNAATSGIVVTNGVAQVNTGTGANQIVKLDNSGKLPAVDGSQLTGIVASSATTATTATTAGTATNFSGTLSGDVSGSQSTTSVDKVKGMSVVTTGAANGKVLKYSSGTLVFADDDTGSAVVDSSYSVKGIVQFDTSAALSGMTVSAGVAKVNAGTAANQIVQLDASAKLPAVDGSALTNIVASSLSGILPINKGGTGQSTKQAGFDALSPLSTKGSIITHDGTNNVALAVGSTNGHVLMVDSSATDGIKWAAPTATDLTTITGTGIVQRTGGGTYAALGTTAPINVTGSNIGLAYSTGLTTNSGSLVVDAGTTANKIVQLDSSAKLPAVDGSALTNIVASSLSGILPIANGGTGASTKFDGFNALSPMTTKGDLIVYDGSTNKNIRLPAGTDGQLLSADAASTGGLKWINAPTTGVSSVSGAVPVVVTGTTTPVISVNDATTSTKGVVQVGAGIAVTSGTISADPANFASAVPIAKGGTGQTTQTAGFNALSPITAKGDLITSDGTNNVRLPAGTTGYVLTADSSAANGIKWAAAAAGGVTSVSGTAPITVTGSTTPVIAINAATTTTQGAVQIGSGIAVTSGTISADPANFPSAVPIAKGGTGATTLTAAGILVNGGNSFGSAASVGTNDAYDFKIRAGNSDRIQVGNSTGNVSIGTGAAANDKLEVNGSIRGVSYDNGTMTTIDWSRGNSQYVTTNCGSQMTFSNMRDGGVYTLAVTASSTFTGSCTFGQTSPDTLSGTAGSGNFYFLPANTTPSGANAVYSFMRVGTKVYVNWSSGYQQ